MQTKLIATHDMDLALEVCDRVIVMNKGQIISVGSPKKVFEDESLLRKCSLEKPLSMQGCLKCRIGIKEIK
jgi:cobalt/nickel transport system ATP-binding protein